MKNPKLTTITPDRASIMLGGDTSRPISGRRVRHYSGMMSRGEWVDCHPSPIVIDERGRVVDGGHRLAAVRKSGVEIKAYVITGASSSLLHHIDDCKVRSLAERTPVLAQSRWANTLLVSTITLWRDIYYRNKDVISHRQLLGLLGESDGHASRIRHVCSAYPSKKRFVTNAPVTLAIAAYVATDNEKAMEFLYSMFNVESQCPQARLLYETNAALAGHVVNPHVAFFRAMHACRLHLHGRVVTRLKGERCLKVM